MSLMSSDALRSVKARSCLKKMEANMNCVMITCPASLLIPI